MAIFSASRLLRERIPPTDQEERLSVQYLALIGLFSLLLFGVTWPLWWSPVSALNPRIPFVLGASNVPAFFDQGFFAMALVGSVMLIALNFFPSIRLQPGLTKHVPKLAIGVYFVGIAGAVSLDQHRLQPWMVQFLLITFLAQISNARDFIRCSKILIAGIYIWSAISKCDTAFLQQHGQLFLNAILDPLGINHQLWSPQFKNQLAAFFPGGELLAGMMLLLPTTRRWGLVISVGMHVVLLWILGAVLQHGWGVILWNLLFIVQNLLLFLPDWNKRFRRVKKVPVAVKGKKKKLAVEPEPAPMIAFERIPVLFLAFSLFYPAFELTGKCDHWPAWAVYCARPAQVTFWIQKDVAEKFPEELKPYLKPLKLAEDYQEFSLEAWSFETRDCPIYPQERFRLAMARALLTPYCPERSLVVEVRSAPDRDTGVRPTKKTIFGIAGLNAYLKQFTLNTEARLGSPQKGEAP